MTGVTSQDQAVARPDGRPAPEPTAAELIEAVADVLRETRPMPLSSNVMVPRDELLRILDAALQALPEELRAARWLLKERDEFLAAAHSEADDIVAAGRAQAEQMVRRTEVVRQSEIYGRRIRDEAEAESRHNRRQTEDYCEQRLAQFDVTLAKIAAAVQSGRDRLRALPQTEEFDVDEVATDQAGGNGDVIDLTDERIANVSPLFDQDLS